LALLELQALKSIISVPRRVLRQLRIGSHFEVNQIILATKAALVVLSLCGDAN
jgi:hypothetical protein